MSDGPEPGPGEHGEASEPDRPTRAGLALGFASVAALVVGLAMAGEALLFYALLFVVFVPLEKLFSLKPQKVFRRGFLTDVTHLITNAVIVSFGLAAAILLAMVPFSWVRHLDLAGSMPSAAAVTVAAVIVVFGQYWAHRLEHEVAFLWRFHAVHHSVVEMDWLGYGRLHPVDMVFTQVVVFVPLYLMGYNAGVFGSAIVLLALIAVFQHANVRLRFPVLRWIIHTPEWHHWHHAIDREAINKNYGLPVIDKLFGTAYMPRGKWPTAFGTSDPVPPVGYTRQLAYPFMPAARAGATSGQVASGATTGE